MAFRANDLAQQGVDSLVSYMINRDFSNDERQHSKNLLYNLVEEYGPVVDSYPSWHPLVNTGLSSSSWLHTTPSRENGYGEDILDHTRYLANAFITCPYGDPENVKAKVQTLIDAIMRANKNFDATIDYKILDAKLYNDGVTPVLIYCEWHRQINSNGTIPLKVAMPLILEQELKNWRTAEVAENWEDMKPYFLGRPHGSQSSLFIEQSAGKEIKKIWNALINTGLYGPIMCSNK